MHPPSAKEEILRLAEEVGRETGKKLPRKRKNSRGQLGYLFAAVAISVGGAAYVAYACLTDCGRGESSDALTMKAEAQRPSFDAQYKMLLRPEPLEGQPGMAAVPKALPASTLKRLFNGKKPLIVDCMLRARLDIATEEDWKAAGLITGPSDPARAFVRRVTICNDEALEMLADWHVEGVLPVESERAQR